MRDLREILERLRAVPPTGPLALATIVRVEGSSYRREGARLLLEPDGRLTGMLSAGCLERDLVGRAAQIVAAGRPRALDYDLTAEGEAIWGAGTGCSGHVTLLVEPLDAAARARWIVRLAALLEERRELRVAVDWSEGDAAAPAGTFAQSEIPAAAALPGSRAIDDALRDLPCGALRSLRFATSSGTRSVLLESTPPPVHLVIVGAERDAPALARLAVDLGWSATVVDPRPDAPDDGRFGEGVRLVGVPPRAFRSRIALDSRTALVLATHRYLDDLAYLAELPGPCGPAADDADAVGYLALLGPTSRRRRLLADLAKLRPAAVAAIDARLRGPAGLDLGGRRPEEVALAIVAEIQSELSRRDARPLGPARAGPTQTREPA